MISDRLIWGAVMLVVLATIAASPGTLNDRIHEASMVYSQPSPTPIKDVPKSNDVPIVDFDSNETLRPEEQDIRTKRGGKYKTTVPIDKIEDQDTVLQDYGSSHRPDDPAFPIDQSDVIVLGTVTDSRALISNDKTAVYSEFQVTRNKIFKNDYLPGVLPDASIIVGRIGGKMRFSSGRIQLRRFIARPLPQKGRQYVFFLKWDDSGKDFSIITGYDVQGNVVQPLDGLELNYTRPFRNYSRYRNADLTKFLSELEEAIIRSSGGMRLSDGRRVELCFNLQASRMIAAPVEKKDCLFW